MLCSSMKRARCPSRTLSPSHSPQRAWCYSVIRSNLISRSRVVIRKERRNRPWNICLGETKPFPRIGDSFSKRRGDSIQRFLGSHRNSSMKTGWDRPQALRVSKSRITRIFPVPVYGLCQYPIKGTRIRR